MNENENENPNRISASASKGDGRRTRDGSPGNRIKTQLSILDFLVGGGGPGLGVCIFFSTSSGAPLVDSDRSNDNMGDAPVAHVFATTTCDAALCLVLSCSLAVWWVTSQCRSSCVVLRSSWSSFVLFVESSSLVEWVYIVKSPAAILRS